MARFEPLPTVRFSDGELRIIDQTLLPGRYEILSLKTLDAVCEAIRSLRVRGAPALGIAGAYGLLVALSESSGHNERDRLEHAAERIAATRPTAVNLAWALNRMLKAASHADDGVLGDLVREAHLILAEDLAMSEAMTSHGANLIADGDAVLTHCNTGGLCSGGGGTALGAVFAAAADGRRVQVFANETRPLLQGARLTAWECAQRGVPVTVLVEGAAASLLSSRKVASVLVGADRIAANGDVANKVGTLGLAILARRAGVPFYVVAPSSTIDVSLPDGAHIPIEHRPDDEVIRFGGIATAPSGVDAYNPAFDVTPADLVDAIVTERGVHRFPYQFTAAR
ncbi:MAG TPA: S-methyl-5-thioribose-1-phosphate isomerase [Candidatus Krumholzibacteria bacterium]|nr:S-methyl-5-thioribose-1-phosphate isomerase [Candidatus Krumholzibacteria bacterium]